MVYQRHFNIYYFTSCVWCVREAAAAVPVVSTAAERSIPIGWYDIWERLSSFPACPVQQSHRAVAPWCQCRRRRNLTEEEKVFLFFLIEKYFITNKTATEQLYLFILSTQIYPNRSFAHTAIKCPSCSSSCVLQVIILVFQVSQFPFRKNIWRSKTKTGLWPVSCCHGNIYRAYWQYRSFQNVLFTWWSAHLSRITIRKNYVDVKQNILHIRGRSLIQFI